MTAASRPVPEPDDTSAPFWAAAAAHQPTAARCSRCGAFALPIESTCPHCHSTDPGFTFEPVSGSGTIRSWTIMHESFLPGFDADVPFVLVDVEIDEQAELRLIGRLLDGVDTPLHLGDRVRAAFEDVAPGVAIPAFVLDAT